jgi:hypothetical protein
LVAVPGRTAGGPPTCWLTRGGRRVTKLDIKKLKQAAKGK